MLLKECNSVHLHTEYFASEQFFLKTIPMKTTYLYLIILFLGFQSVFAQDVTLVSKNSSWKYYQAGNMPTGDWTTAGYSDAAWGSGNAILAWGGLTVGTTATTLTTRVETIYFRQSFNYTKTGTETKLVLNYVFDDGAVVYLNGTEIARINMPTGTPTYSTWTSGVGNESTYTLLELPPAALTALVNGTNLLALEVHNVSNTSSDLGMDCSLTVSSASQTAACKHIRFGSSGNPLNGLTISWRNVGTSDKIRWGYLSSYEKGEFSGTRRTIYTDNQFDYVFPSPVTPNATIYYQLYDSQSGLWTTQKTYKTCSDESTNKFSFTSLGDSRTNLADWQAVANAAAANQSDFVMFGGDITNAGIGTEYDSWFDYAPGFIQNSVFYHTVGNHEIVSDAALVNYKDLYTMPGNEEYFSFTYGNAIFLVINSEKPSDASQLAWLQSTLAANTGKTWKFVMFHRPFYTSPSHGGEMDSYLGTIWKAFDDYGVDIVLNGHTHNYQRTKPINRNVSTTTAVAEYGSNPGQGRCEIVAGAAGAPLSGAATAGLWWLESTLNDHHYCNIAIDGNTLTFKAYSRDQTVFDQFTISKVAAEPVISNVQAVNISETSASINWTTDLASSSEVEYGTSTYTQTTSGTSNVTNHSVPLTGLQSGTMYHYRVKSNEIYSGDYTFTTQVSVVSTSYSPATTVIATGSSTGVLSNLSTSNNSYYVVNSSKAKPFISDWYGVVSIQNTNDIIRFTVKYEGKYSRSVNQIVYLRNFNTNNWVQIDARTVSTTDIPITSIQNAPANFISSNGEIWVRVYATTSSKSFTCSGDFMQIIVERQAASQLAFKSAQKEFLVTSIDLEDIEDEFILYPNPASENVIFRFNLISDSSVDISIFDLRGTKVAQVTGNKSFYNGSNEVLFKAEQMSPGIYFCKLKTNNSNKEKIIKLIIQR